ncbi:HAD family hydrolase [Novipirellula sp. SH528]|uniref:HAD family hydrolase n=1 Tax=Novipirellula sp. SH528 TaxID=3454466 RepID=UPI003FA06F5F
MNDFDTTGSQSSDEQSDAARKPVRGVALDMDGLLIDTERLYWQVGDTLLQRRGYRYSRELQARMMGRIGVSAIAQMIEMHHLSDSPEALLAESDELYGALLSEQLRPMPGLSQWMDSLQQSGLPFGLATSSQRKFVDVILPTFDWSDQLAFVLTGNDVVNGKPHPEMYLSAAEKMQIPASDMLVLEDSGNGCVAALAAGAQTVAVPSEHTKDQSFSGVMLIADSLLDPRLHKLIA